MLPDHQLQLLTAYVDGELSPRQQRQVTHLLNKSEEARILLRQLEADSRQLIDLPQVKAPVDLTGSVLSAIERSKRRPVARARPVRAGVLPTWIGWAAAAAVLLAVAGGTFLEHVRTPKDTGVVKPGKPNDNQPDERNGNLVNNQPGPSPVESDDPPAQPEEDSQETPDRTPIKKPLPPDPDEDLPKPPKVIFGKDGKELDTQFERILVSLPTVLKLHELGKREESRKLQEQLAKGSAFRIELPAKNATHGFHRLREAFQKRKITLLIDASAQAKLKMPQFRHDYALFIENIPAADLTEILAAVGVADRTAGEKKSSEGRFDGALVVKRMSSLDAKELAGLLGIDPTKERPDVLKPRGIDLKKPISEQTADQVIEILDGKRAPRPDTAQPDLTAIVLPLAGVRSRSVEVKQFLESRKPARPGTVQVFLVLRQLPG